MLNLEKYIRLQSASILARLEKFDKVYLEFGGKLFDDHHASRVLPGFEPDTKIKMLAPIRDKCEVILVISGRDIKSGKTRGDYGITYAEHTLDMLRGFEEAQIDVNSVVINRFQNSKIEKELKSTLENLGIKVYQFKEIEGYPYSLDRILSDSGYGAQEFIQTTKPVVIITAAGPGSGKMSVALTQLYNEYKRGNKGVGYAKFETFPVWNLPPEHPVNLAYEAATVDIGDVNITDTFHFKAKGIKATNYDRDVVAFPILQTIFQKIYGKDVYASPTEMGVNVLGDCIEDMDAVITASKDEIRRRYDETLEKFNQGKFDHLAVLRIKSIMAQAGLKYLTIA